MRTTRSALGQLLDELRLLFGQTFRVLAKLAAPIFGLLLVGWSAYILASLAASALACVVPWVVVPIMAVCVVVQLACILAVLRLTALHLGMPQVLARTTLHTEVSDDRDTSPAHLMAVALLPFLGMYAGFGYLSDFTRSAVVVSSYRCGIPALLTAFSPQLDGDFSAGGMSLWLLVAIVVALQLLKRIFETLRERVRHPIVPAFAQISVETLMAFLMLLGGFRLWQELDLWWTDTVVALWWRTFLEWALAATPDLVVQIWTTVTGFVSDTLWPLVVSDVLRPFLWLAMAGLVFGTRALALTDFWILGRSRRAGRRSRWVAKLQEDSETAQGLRLVTTKAAEFALGGVESKLLPAWQSLRLVLSAGWPFLGAFAIAFAVIDKARALPHLALVLLTGGHPGEFWLRLWPIEGLIGDVLVLGFMWVMLAVAYTRGLSIFAERTAQSELDAVLVAGPTITAALKQSRWQAVSVVAVATVVVAAVSAIPATVEADYRDGVPGEVVSIDEFGMSIGQPRLAKQLSGYEPKNTNLVFLVVPVELSNPGPHSGSYQLSIKAGERTYRPWDGTMSVTARPGFRMSTEIVFEIQPDDAGPGLELLARRLEVLSEYQQVARFNLGLEPDAAVLPTTEVSISVWAAA